MIIVTGIWAMDSTVDGAHRTVVMEVPRGIEFIHQPSHVLYMYHKVHNIKEYLKHSRY